MTVPGVVGGWADEVAAINMLIDDLVWPTTGSHARGRRRRQGRSRPVDGARSRRPAARRRVPRGPRKLVNKMIDQLSVFTSEVTPRRARGRHRRQARRTGAGPRRVGRVEGADRVGQPDGRQPDGAGPQHRRRDDRRRQRRPLEEDHGRRPRRNPAAEGSHQHDGRSAARLRGRGHARARAKSAPTASWAARRSCRAWRARGRTSPTRSTRWRRT